MRICKIDFNLNSPAFNAKRNNSIQTKPIKDESKKLNLCLAGLAVIGAATVTGCILKNKKINPINVAKNKLDNFKSLLSKKPQIDPIIEKLNGNRGKDAIELYNSYRAVDKLNSFQNKLLKGHFDGKSPEVFEILRRNEQNLKKQAALIA